MMRLLLRCLFLGGLIIEREKGRRRRPIKKTKMDVSAILHKSRPSTDLVKKRSNGQCTHMLLKGADLLLQTLYNSKQSWQGVNSVHYLLFSGDPLHLSFNASTTCSLKKVKVGFAWCLLSIVRVLSPISASISYNFASLLVYWNWVFGKYLLESFQKGPLNPSGA